MPQDKENARRLGMRDARAGQAATHPVHPFSSEELEAYQQGYASQRKLDVAANNRRRELSADYPVSTYTGAPGETRMQSELADAFNLVANKENWKLPIDVTLDMADVNIRLIVDAVVHFTGSVPSFTYIENRIHIRAAGYYATVGA